MKTCPIRGPGCALPWQCSWVKQEGSRCPSEDGKIWICPWRCCSSGLTQKKRKQKGNFPIFLHVFQMVKTESSAIVYLDSQSCHKDPKASVPSAGRGFYSMYFLHACSSLGFTYVQISTAQMDYTCLILLPLTWQLLCSSH